MILEHIRREATTAERATIKASKEEREKAKQLRKDGKHAMSKEVKARAELAGAAANATVIEKQQEIVELPKKAPKRSCAVIPDDFIDSSAKVTAMPEVGLGQTVSDIVTQHSSGTGLDIELVPVLRLSSASKHRACSPPTAGAPSRTFQWLSRVVASRSGATLARFWFRFVRITVIRSWQRTLRVLTVPFERVRLRPEHCRVASHFFSRVKNRARQGDDTHRQGGRRCALLRLSVRTRARRGVGSPT